MNENEIELVQQSFTQVEQIADVASQIFYERLFELDPELRPLFKGDLVEQRRKLMQTLTVAVRGLNNVENLIPVLQSLAVRHVGYGVHKEHYTTVGAALLWTLGQGLGDGFTAEVKAAWTAVYTLISDVMIDAAEAVSVA